MLNQRSVEKEWLDLGANYYTLEEYYDCLKKLFCVNVLFGFFHGTVKTLKKFPKNASLLDIGCGGGLFLLHLSRYFPNMKLTGLDIAAAAIHFAKQELQLWQKATLLDNVSFICQLSPDIDAHEDEVDIILATLVCHHLTDHELIEFLQKTVKKAKMVVIINDLHRHVIPYGFYKLFSPILFRNRLITHDGLISIRRGFTRREWHRLLNQAGIKQYQIKWCFPFRWRVMLWKT